jgi:hypothetical protein
MRVGQRGDGKWTWVIKVGDDVVASDANQGYENEKDCLHSLFGMFFGTWDESYLDLYEKWNSYGGEAQNLPPEAQQGPNVLVQTQEQRDAIEAHKTGRHDEHGRLVNPDGIDGDNS